MTADEAEQALVDAARFGASVTRRRLWDGLEAYLGRFFELERQYAEELAGRQLIHALWLGGSFVSTRVDPNNIDLTVIVDGQARDTLKGLEGSGWLTKAFSREARLDEFGVSPIELRYWPVVSVFRPASFEAHEAEYLSGRGAWDDWWQRCRIEGQTGEPTLDTVVVRRGYLEVIP